MMDVFYHCTTSLSQRSHFFVRPCVLSGGATYPNTSIMSLSSISLMEMESFLSTCIFSYSARQDVQMPIFWPPPHKRPKMDISTHIIYVRITRQSLLHSQGSLISPCYLYQSYIILLSHCCSSLQTLLISYLSLCSSHCAKTRFRRHHITKFFAKHPMLPPLLFSWISCPCDIFQLSPQFPAILLLSI
jgi:hypothetical protein